MKVEGIYIMYAMFIVFFRAQSLKMRKFHCVELFLEAIPQKSAAHACDASLLTLTISMKIWGFWHPQFSGRKVPHPWLPRFTPLHHEISELDIATLSQEMTGNTMENTCCKSSMSCIHQKLQETSFNKNSIRKIWAQTTRDSPDD